MAQRFILALVLLGLHGCGTVERWDGVSSYPPDGYETNLDWVTYFDILPGSGTITSVEDQTPFLRIHSADHGLVYLQNVVIRGTTNYDGEYIVALVTSGYFDIVGTFVATDTGTWVSNRAGPDCIRFSNSTLTDHEYVYDEFIPASDGSPYRMSAVVQATSVSAGRTVSIGLKWYDSGENLLSTSYAHNAVLPAVGEWFDLTDILVAPAGARFMKPFVSKNSTAGAFYLHLDDIAVFEMPVVASAKLGSNQSVASGSHVVLQFSSEEYDYGANFDTTNYRFVAPSDGLYSISGSVSVAVSTAPDSGMYMFAWVRKNGVGIFPFGSENDATAAFSSSTYQWGLSLSSVEYLQSGDYIDVTVIHSNTANLIIAGGGLHTRLNVARVE